MSDRTTIPGGFLIDSERLKGKVYVLTEPWREKFFEQFGKNQIIGLRLSLSAGWKGGDIDFISTLPPLSSIEIYHSDIKDVSVLVSHPGLQHIGLSCPYSKVDFQSFTMLTHLGLNWRPAAKTLFSCTSLTNLNLSGYPNEDLEVMKSLIRLRSLTLLSKKLQNLNGFQALVELQDVKLSNCSSLSNIDQISALSALRKVEFTTCKKINNIDSIGHLRELDYFLMENCGKIDSIIKVARCDALQSIYLIGTDVVNGDMSPLLELKHLTDVVIFHHPHHSHTEDEILALL